MGPSVLQLRRRSGCDDAATAWEDARTAWWAVGLAGRIGVVVFVAACAGVAAWWLPATARVLGTAATLVVLAAAALVDVVEHRLPNSIVATAALPVAGTVILGWEPAVARSVLFGAVALALPLLVTHLVSPSGMGFGDVKAGLVLGAALGLIDGQLALVALVLGLGTAAGWGVVRRARAVPLGPGLVLGALAALAIGRLIGVEAR